MNRLTSWTRATFRSMRMRRSPPSGRRWMPSGIGCSSPDLGSSSGPAIPLTGSGIGYWAGPRSLPLWLPAAYAGFARRRADAFGSTGGTTRPLAMTVTRTLEDELKRGVDRPRRAGLTQADEFEIIRTIMATRNDTE